MKCDMHVHARGRNPEDIYIAARKNGMDLVTITEHQDISPSLELSHKHPDTSFTGCEITTKWKKEYLKLDILIYGLNSQEFFKANKLRKTGDDLLKYLKDCGLVHAIAHPKQSLIRQEKMNMMSWVLSIAPCEGINYSKPKGCFNGGLIAGSDAHNTRIIGNAYTEVDGVNTIDGYFYRLKDGKTNLCIKENA